MSRYGLPHWLRGRTKIRRDKAERHAKWLRSWFYRPRVEQLEDRLAPGSMLANVLGGGNADPDSVLPTATADTAVVQRVEHAGTSASQWQEASAFLWAGETPTASRAVDSAESKTPAAAEAPYSSVSTEPLLFTGPDSDLDNDPFATAWTPFGPEATPADSGDGGGGSDLGGPSRKLGTADSATDNQVASSAPSGGGYSATGGTPSGGGIGAPTGGSDWALSAFVSPSPGGVHSSLTPALSPTILPAPSRASAPSRAVAPSANATHPAAEAAPTFTPPVLDAVQRFGPAGHERLLIHGSLANTAPLGSSVTLDFFAKEPGSSTSQFLGSKSVTQTTAGSIDFTVNLAAKVPPGTVIAAAVHGRSDGPAWNQSAELPGGTPSTHLLGKPPAEVVTIPAGTKGQSITLESPGHPLENVQVMTPPGLGDALPLGLVGFTVMNVPAGGSAIVRMILPNDVHVQNYYKHDPVTGAVTLFNFDGHVGAEIHGNVVTLHLVDGGPGDADGVANGVIVDPGGVGTTLPSKVVVVPAATDGELVTLESAYNLLNVQTYGPPATGVVLPLGLFGFTVAGVPLAGTADVQMIVPDDVFPSRYIMQDPISGLLTPFEAGGTPGADIDGHTITLHFVDGGTGDDDGFANGVIVDPGGPGAGTITIPCDSGVSGGGWTVFQTGGLSPFPKFLPL